MSMDKTTDFINKANLKHNNEFNYDLVNYINAHIKVKIKCKYNHIFEQSPNHHLTGNGCSICAGKNKNTDSFINESKNKYGEIFNYSKTVYNGTKNNIILICNNGHEFITKAEIHLRKNSNGGCKLCANKKTGDDNSYNKSEWIKLANIRHNELYIYDNVIYINSQTEVAIICKVHGQFLQLPSIHLQGSGCSKCGIYNSKIKKGICLHGKQKTRCKECGGGSICEHNKRRSVCVVCGGGELCIHKKQKAQCIACKGSQICEHKKIRSQCKDCKGPRICEHDKYKAYCKECGGSQICQHNKIKRACKECSGKGFCIHDKQKTRCKECGGSALCVHNKRKDNCKECDGSRFCIHNKYRDYCKECGGKGFCIHGKRKNRCKECGGSQICKTPLCDTQARNKKYDGYCMFCYIHLFPDKSVTRNYKTKERSVVEFVLNTFPQYDWVEDKKVEDGCSRRRPDLLLDLGYQVIIIEIDETQHRDYDCSCENKRIMEISKDLGHRPIIFLRFNPDEYFDEEGNIIKSCWKINKSGLCTIDDKKEWDNRLNSLKLQIEYWCNPENKTEKTIETIHMYYDECEIDTESEEYSDEELLDETEEDTETNDNIFI